MSKTVRKPCRRLPGLALAACLVVTACGGGDGDRDGGEGRPAVETPSATPTPTVAVPAGVTLTEPGTELTFGEAATVRYAPNPNVEAFLTFTVERARLGRLSDLKGFNLDTDYKRNANYYFVDVTVENVGETDLGGRDVPLNGVNQDDTRLPPVVFQSAFATCPSKPLPKAFGPGDAFATCLVFLSPDKGDLASVSTLTDGTVEPVTWTGTVEPPPARKKQRQNG